MTDKTSSGIDNPNPDPADAAQSDEKLVAERRKKLDAIRAAGVAFPNDFVRRDLAQNVGDVGARPCGLYGGGRLSRGRGGGRCPG